MALLEVEDLRTHFFTREGVVHAVDGVLRLPYVTECFHAGRFRRFS